MAKRLGPPKKEKNERKTGNDGKPIVFPGPKRHTHTPLTVQVQYSIFILISLASIFLEKDLQPGSGCTRQTF